MMAASSWAPLEVVLAPGLVMLFGSAFAIFLRVPEKIQACTQNFSAGLLISAVAGELYPLMSPDTLSSTACIVAIACGFFVGLLFMFGLEHLTEEDEGCEGKSPASPGALLADLSEPMLDGEESQALANFCKTARQLKNDVRTLMGSIEGGQRDAIDTVVHDVLSHVDQAERQLTLTGPLSTRELERMKFHCEELEAQGKDLSCKSTVAQQRRALRVFKGTLNHIHEHAERKRFQRWKPAPLRSESETEFSEKVPWALVASVAADGGVDGLLIGLAFAASPGAGWAMSIATCIEMGFLGLSFSATISNATRSIMKIVPIVALPSMLLMVGGVLGNNVGDALHGNPALFVGFIGFAVVCLLFLVTQELLMEAHEVGGDNVVINVMLFVGLFGGIVLEKFVG